VRNTGHDGIVVKGGEKHTIEGCEIHDTGQAGIRIEGGDRKTLTPCGHEAVNNHIHHVSRRQRTTAYHVHLRGVGIRLAHNLLHDSPHQSIGIGGNDHIIEFNEIHHISMDSDDCGAFYMGRNPSERGTMIRHNFWHHIGSDFAHGSCAVYFDDGAGGQTVFGNVFYKAAGGNFGAVFMHGGHDNLVDNNIFIECKAAMRQASWNDDRWRKALAADDYQNKLVRDVDISKPPYVDRYPALKGFMDYQGGPRLNYAKRNVIVKCGIVATGNWMNENTLVLDHDPGFIDAAAMNFGLKEDSLVYSQIKGFQAIPFEKIGLQKP
jgi:parallel beta helix pectate lyase-like protein